MEENISDIKNDDSKIKEVNNKDSNQNEILIEQKEKKK